jgi:hypothetical protein
VKPVEPTPFQILDAQARDTWAAAEEQLDERRLIAWVDHQARRVAQFERQRMEREWRRGS